MGVLALVGLWWTNGDITTLVVMYAINVFLSFSLTMLGMIRWWIRAKSTRAVRARRLALFGTGFVICATILGVTAWQEFDRGGSTALIVTGLLTALCLLIHGHYRLTISNIALDKRFQQQSGSIIKHVCILRNHEQIL